MKQSKQITVEATQDVMGNLFLVPRVRRFAKAFRSKVVENGGPAELSIVGQEGTPFREDLLRAMPARKVRELLGGFTVAVLADPWTVGHWYGWDAHEAELPFGR